VLIFDEPINGLDPEGILWVRHLLRSLADEGRTVLVSSHLMSEMALTADHLIVIGAHPTDLNSYASAEGARPRRGRITGGRCSTV